MTSASGSAGKLFTYGSFRLHLSSDFENTGPPFRSLTNN